MRKSFTRLLSLVMFLTLLSSFAMAAVTTWPKDGTTPAYTKTTDKIMVIFPEAVKAGSGYVRLYSGASGTNLERSILASDSRISYAKGDTVVIDFSADQKELVKYTVVVDANVFKTVANSTAISVPQWSYTVGDYTAPVLSKVEPVKDATVGQLSSLKVTFTDASPVLKGTGKVALYKADGNVWDLIDVATRGTVTDGTTAGTYVLTLTGIRGLEDLTSYAVTVGAGVVTDNGLRADEKKNSFAGLTDRTVWTFNSKDFTVPGFATDYPKASNIKVTSFDILVKTAEAGNFYAKAYTTTQTVDETLLGDLTGTTAVTLTAGAEAKKSFSSLAKNTKYYVYVVTKNADVSPTADDISGPIEVTTIDSDKPSLANIVYVKGDDEDVVSVTNNVAGFETIDQKVSKIILDFSDSGNGAYDEIAVGSGSIVIYKKSDNTVFATVDASNVTINDENNAVVTLSKVFDNATEYYAFIPATLFKDQYGNFYGGITTTTGWRFKTNDIVAPTIVSYTPAQGTTEVLKDKSIVVKFSEVMNLSSSGSTNTDYFTLEVKGIEVPYTYTHSTNNNAFSTVTINPDADFVSSAVVTLTVNGNIADLSGNVIGLTQGVSFVAEDYVGPTMEFTSIPEVPADPIVVKFNEPIRLLGGTAITASNLYTLVTLKEGNADGVNVPADYTIDNDKKVITITPKSPWTSGATYFVAISSDVEDASENKCVDAVSQRSTSFTVDDVIPSTVSIDKAGKTDVVVGNPTTTVVIKFKNENNVADPVGSVYYAGTWTAYTSASQLENVIVFKEGDANGPNIPFEVTSADGATFSVTAALAGAKTYYIGLGAATKDGAGNVNAPLYGSFTTLFVGAPKVVSLVPSNEQKEVAVKAEPVITFNTDIKLIGSASYTGSDVVTLNGATVPYDKLVVSGKTLTIKHSADFDSNTTYAVVVPTTVVLNKITPFAGIEAIGDWTFTTVDKRFEAFTLSPDYLEEADLDETLVIEVPEKVVAGTGNISIKNADTDYLIERIASTSAQVKISYDSDNSTIEITPSANFVYGAKYYVEVDKGAFADLYANPIPAIVGKTSSATTTNWTFTAVNSDLSIVKVTPQGENVATDAEIVVKFNRDIKKGTSGQVGFNEYKTSDGSLRQEVRYGITSSNLVVSGNTLTIKHADKLFTNDSKVYLVLENGAILAATKSSTITVSGAYTTTTTEGNYFYVGDALAPVATVVPTWDADDANYVQVNTNITITFNEDVLNAVTGLALTNDNVSYSGGIIELQGPSGLVDFVGTVSGRTITVDPTSNLDESADYTVRIVANKIKDTHSHTMGLVEKLFKTTDTTLPSISGTVGTSAGDNSVTVSSIVVTEIHPNKLYYVLKKKADAAPTAEEVKAANAKSYSNNVAIDLGTFDNLLASTTYVLYYLADDTFGNTTTVKSKEISTVDAVAPLLVSVDPANGTLNVDYAKDIVFTFNEAVQLGSGNVYFKDKATNTILSVVAVSGSTMTVVAESSSKKIALTENFADGFNPVQVYIEMDKGAILDNPTNHAPNQFAGIFGSDKVYFTYEDNTQPVLESFDYSGETVSTVALNSNIVLNFSEEVQAGTANAILYEDGTAIEVFKGTEVAISGKSVTINPTYNFNNNTDYTIEVQEGFVKDKSANKNVNVADDAIVAFTTSENVAPTVEVDPEEFEGNNKMDLTSIDITFDENVFLTIAGLKKSLLVLTDADVKSKVSFTKADGTAVPFTVESKDEDYIHLVVDIADLADLTSYVLTIGGFIDEDGLVMETKSFNYTTGDGKAPTFVFDPLDKEENVVPTTPLTITFSENIYHWVGNYNEDSPDAGHAALFYEPFTNDNVDEIISLVDVTDGYSAVPFDATFNGTNVITITPKTALKSGHKYLYGFDGDYVTDIHHNYVYGDNCSQPSLNLKSVTINGSSVKTCAEFTVLDIEEPTFALEDVSPAPESVSVPANADMWIKFNEDILVGTGTITIRYEDGVIFESISGSSLSIDDDGKTLVIAHKNFDSDATYFVEIGEGVVTDKTGNKNEAMIDPTKWTFTTKDTFELTAITTTPSGDNTPRNVNLEIAFNKVPSKEAGKYLAVYKADGTAVYQLAVASSSIVGKSAVFSNIALDADQAYYARVEPNAFVDGSGNKFAGIMDNSWEFSTVNNIAPKVVSLSPADNASAVDTQTSALVMTFDRDIAAGSGMIAVRNTTNGDLFEEVSVANAVVNGKTLTVNLTKSLVANTSYYVIVPASAVTNTEITKDAFAGILNTYTWNFTTSTDQTAPKLVTWTPNATTIADNHPAFTMVFDENVVLGAGNLKVYKAADGSLALTIPVTASMVTGKTVSVTYTFDATLKNGLDKNTDYYVLVDAGVVKDAAANAFAGVTATTTWTFKTGADFATDTDPVIDNSLEFKVYPNPFVDYVIVDNASELTKIVVTNIAGQVVKEVVTPDSRIQLNELRSGVYFISLYKGNTVAKTVKIVKR